MITVVLSNRFICNEKDCDFGTCTSNQCNHNTYICTSNTTTCSLNCQDCTNITFISSSNHTEISCNSSNSCNNMTIEILQIDTKLNSNSFLLTCFYSSSCINMNILCTNPSLCQCKDNNNNNIQCNNNNNNIPITTTTYTLINNIVSISNGYNNTQTIYDYENNNNIQTQNNENNEQGTAVILIIFVILFWCLVCLCVPIYINRWRQKMLLKDAQEGMPQQYNGNNNINPKPKSPKQQIKDGIIDNHINININNNEINDILSKSLHKKISHRRVLSDSMMARIVNNKSEYINDSNNNENDIEIYYIDQHKETMIQTAEDMVRHVHTNHSGELALNNITPRSVESVPSQMLDLPKFDSNKAQKLSLSPTQISDMTNMTINALKLPKKLSNSIESVNTINTIQISMMSPSNFSPPTNNDAMEVLSYLSGNDLELLYTESEVNQKLNGDYVD